MDRADRAKPFCDRRGAWPAVVAAGAGWLAGLAVLAISGAKARIILADYLELAEAPGILRGFGIVLGLFLLGAAGLYLAG